MCGLTLNERQGMASNDEMSVAMAEENAIRIAAEVLWEEHGTLRLTPALYATLVPLLRQPIPSGFIVTTGAVKGKPYESTGVKSVQVLVNRMDAVLMPQHWSVTDEYENDGRLCRATVTVLDGDGQPIVSRSSYGGVDRASSLGNLMKGSFTNAAKRAFAMVGPGHEVYVGAVDYDPDVSVDAAKEQEQPVRASDRPSVAAEPDVPIIPPEHALDELLAKEDELTGLRKKADDGMKILGAKPSQRLRELQAASTKRDLEALINRVDASLEAGA